MWVITYEHAKSLMDYLHTPQMKDALNSFMQREQQKNVVTTKDGGADDSESVEEN